MNESPFCGAILSTPKNVTTSPIHIRDAGCDTTGKKVLHHESTKLDFKMGHFMGPAQEKSTQKDSSKRGFRSKNVSDVLGAFRHETVKMTLQISGTGI